MGAARMPEAQAWRPLAYAVPVEEARHTLRVSLQVAQEAFADGLFTDEELGLTVAELREEYRCNLSALGVDARTLPDPTTDPPPPPRSAAGSSYQPRPAASERAASSGSGSSGGGACAVRAPASPEPRVTVNQAGVTPASRACSPLPSSSPPLGAPRSSFVAGHLAALRAAECEGLVAPGSHAQAQEAALDAAQRSHAAELSAAQHSAAHAHQVLSLALEQLESEREAAAHARAHAQALSASVVLMGRTLDASNAALADALAQVAQLRERLAEVTLSQHADHARVPATSPSAALDATPSQQEPCSPPTAAPASWELPPPSLQQGGGVRVRVSPPRDAAGVGVASPRTPLPVGGPSRGAGLAELARQAEEQGEQEQKQAQPPSDAPQQAQPQPPRHSAAAPRRAASSRRHSPPGDAQQKQQPLVSSPEPAGLATPPQQQQQLHAADELPLGCFSAFRLRRRRAPSQRQQWPAAAS